MDKLKFCKRVAIWVAVIAAALIAIIGLCSGKVIEGSLFAEIAKWVVMGAVVIGSLSNVSYPTLTVESISDPTFYVYVEVGEEITLPIGQYRVTASYENGKIG